MFGKASFGQWLKQRRKTLDLTQEELAGRIGCAAVTLRKIETDERRPSKQLAALLAQHLNIPTDQFQVFIHFARVGTMESAASFGTSSRPPTNLTTPPTPLIGRDVDVAAIRKRLLQPDLRLLTLIGAPGIGKTRLATQVAIELLDEFADGVFFVALAPITDPNLVPTAIANMLGVPEVGPHKPLEHLKTFLRDKQLLLVLDNVEQVLAAAPQIAELLASCPFLKLLVTSRAPLKIRPERQYPVSPLALPDLAHLPDIDALVKSAAVALFVERAQAVKPDFALTPDNAPTVAAICARLDGLPLAIELISARIKLLPPTMLLERLSGSLLLQTDGMSDLDPRHHTLHAAIEWSYHLLNAEEQTLFRRLSVFVGGWTLKAAEIVCSADIHLNIVEGLASLQDKNLVMLTNDSDHDTRFMMLETIREYALEQTSVNDATNHLRAHHTTAQRHLAYFVKLAEEGEAHAYGHDQLAWYDRQEAELDNLRAALTWSLNSGEIEMGLRMAGALRWVWEMRGHLDEGANWMEKLLPLSVDVSPNVRAKALHRASELAGQSHRRSQASDWGEESLRLARATNDKWNIAWALSALALLSAAKTLSETSALLVESIGLFRELDDSFGLSHALRRFAAKAINQGEYPYAQTLVEEALARDRKVGDKNALAWELTFLGDILWQRHHNPEQVQPLFEEGLTLFREMRFVRGIGYILHSLADFERSQQSNGQANSLFEEALRLLQSSGLQPTDISVVTVVCIGGLAIAKGNFERGVRLFGGVDTRFIKTTSAISQTYINDTAFARVKLGDSTFEKAWAEGEAMTWDQVVAYALDT